MGCLLSLVAVCLGAGLAGAQTATFTGAVTQLGGGISYPTGIAVDGSANVYFVSGNSVHEMLSAAGYTTVNTLGSGFSVPYNVAVDGSGNVFVADTGHNAVKEILAVGGVIPNSPTINSLGTSFTFSSPHGLAVDASGNVFVADSGNNAVEEIVAAGGYTTVNQLGVASGNFSGSTGVAVDASENVFVADTNNGAVKEILAAGGYTTVNTLGTGFGAPAGVAVDANENVFVANRNSVQEMVAAGGYITLNTLASGFLNPKGLALIGNDDIFVADTNNEQVKELEIGSVNFGNVNIGRTGFLESFTFSFITGGAIAAPAVLTQGAANLDFIDAGTGSCTTNGTSRTYSVGDTCTVDVKFKPAFPGSRRGAVELSTNGGAVLATDYVYGAGVGPQVAFSSGAASTIPGSWGQPSAVAVDATGNLYVADAQGNQISKAAASGGGFGTSIPIVTGLLDPSGVAVDGAGDVYYADTNNNNVAVLPWNGASYGPPVNIPSGLTPGWNAPSSVAVDGQQNLFVTDRGNNQVVELPWTGSGYGLGRRQ
jgi:sugar lactone lactonase YvrE